MPLILNDKTKIKPVVKIPAIIPRERSRALRREFLTQEPIRELAKNNIMSVIINKPNPHAKSAISGFSIYLFAVGRISGKVRIVVIADPSHETTNKPPLTKPRISPIIAPIKRNKIIPRSKVFIGICSKTSALHVTIA